MTDLCCYVVVLFFENLVEAIFFPMELAESNLVKPIWWPLERSIGVARVLQGRNFSESVKL